MLNPKEAPAGYEAVPFIDCSACAFCEDTCVNYNCCSLTRRDRTPVMFIKSYDDAAELARYKKMWADLRVENERLRAQLKK